MQRYRGVVIIGCEKTAPQGVTIAREFTPPITAKQRGGATNPLQHTQGEQKLKTEQASHQGGGSVRTDHKPQGPGTQK